MARQLNRDGGINLNQSRTRRSPPAKLSTVRIEGGGDDCDEVSRGGDRKSVVLSRLLMLVDNSNSNRLLLLVNDNASSNSNVD